MSLKVRLGLLGFILLTGFLLRAYNLNFPSIGYQSMQENMYLGIAQEMQRTQDYVNRRIYFLDAFKHGGLPAAMYNQPAMVSYQTVIAWKLFGENLWAPRLVNVAFGLLSIMVMYLAAGLIFADAYPALFCAFLLAVTPLAAFFSRNLQPESPAFFFMLLGNFSYLRFLCPGKYKNKYLFLGGLCLSVAWLYRFDFIIGFLPPLACLIISGLRREYKHFSKRLFAFFAPYLVIPIFMLWFYRLGQWQFRMDLNPAPVFSIFMPSNLQRIAPILLRYAVGENFTPVFSALSLLGIVIAFFRTKSLAGRYIIGWVIAAAVFLILNHTQASQNNYAQMPFLLPACIAGGFALSHLSGGVRRLIRINIFLPLAVAVCGVSMPFVYGSLSRMHATVFPGMDVAGESLKEFTQTGDYVFLLSHSQGWGISRYARRYVRWSDDPRDFAEKERRYNIKYICFYPADLAISLKNDNPPLYNYIKANYRVKEAGLSEEPRRLYYVILERGKPLSEEGFLGEFQGPLRLRTIYQILGRYYFFYSVRPAAGGAATDAESAPGVGNNPG